MARTSWKDKGAGKVEQAAMRTAKDEAHMHMQDRSTDRYQNETHGRARIVGMPQGVRAFARMRQPDEEEKE